MEKEQLRKYLNNQCTPEEAGKVLAWINSDANRIGLIKSIEDDWEAFGNEVFLTPSSFSVISNKVKNNLGEECKTGFSGKRGSIWMVAASVVLLLTLSLFIISRDNVGDEFSERVTLKGERSTIHLSDGSSILLDSDSRIIYPLKLTNNNREIYLEGQAFFKLASSNSITINSNNVTTVARSTSFSVSAFPEMDKIVVAVDEGTAEVTAGEERFQPLIKLQMPKTIPLTKLRKSTVVNEKEFIAYDKNGDTLQKDVVINDNQIFGWKNGVIFFKDANPDEIARTLERWYGVNICYDGKIKGLLSGEYSNMSVEEVLKDLDKKSNSKFKIGEKCI